MADLMGCPDCETVLVQVQRKPAVSIAGLFSVVMFIAGLLLMLLSVLLGVILCVLGLLVGLAAGQELWMVCPKCKKDVVRLK